MSRILLVEDDPILGRSLSLNLRLEGYDVEWARDLKDAFRREAETPFDLLVLDLELPDGLGLELCKRLRDQGSEVPILILTARGHEDSAVESLYSGANDYIRKPFGNRELLARIRIALKEPMRQTEQLQYGELLLLPPQRKAFVANQEIELNRREFDVLTVLTRKAGDVVTRDSLIQALPKDADIFDRTIDSHVSHVRTKLRRAGVASLRIASVYGLGYRLEQAP